MARPSRVDVVWSGPDEAIVVVEGVCDAALVARLDGILDGLLRGGAVHLVVGLQRLTGDDTGLIELLAATCHRVWRIHGTVEIDGLRHRLVSRPEVCAFPEVFGDIGESSRTIPEALTMRSTPEPH